MPRLFTSESVTEGHPDKICDQISDGILDEILRQDPQSRVAVETMVTTGLVHVAGEVRTGGYADIPSIVRNTILGIGYDNSHKGFDGRTCGVEVSIGEQSGDIALGVDNTAQSRTGESTDALDVQGAGDQGLMFGYACDDTPELMPLPIFLAHRLAEQLSSVRKSAELDYLRPDGKTQVTIEYDGSTPSRLDTIVLSTQHAEGISLEGQLGPDIRSRVIAPVLQASHDIGVGIDTSNFKVLINPTGTFVVGGPMGDAGLTGRKIIVDT
ncbi:MAG: methionine adenosyltransferase, partial [Ornithinimicrobium sp.]